MEKRALGNTGISVSEIAFGGVEIGMPYGIGIKDKADMLSHSDAIHLLHTAVDSGINLFDTARLYGESEIIMGRAFQDRRDQVVLATKCAHFLDERGEVPPYVALKEIITRSLEESLQALRTDFIDLYMLHQSDHGILESEDVRQVFQELKRSGKIRACGLSVYQPGETALAIEKGCWDVIQAPFNLMDQRQASLFPLARTHGVGLIIRSVLLKGLLSERGRNLHPALRDVETHIHGYRRLIGDDFPDLPTLATKFALSFPEVSSVLVGIDRPEYLEKTLQAADGIYLDQARLAQAEAMAYPDADFLDLPKWDRVGWLT